MTSTGHGWGLMRNLFRAWLSIIWSIQWCGIGWVPNLITY